MTVTTIVVATAIPVMLAVFRTRFMKPDITPYLLRSTTLRIELLLGALNVPVPMLCVTVPRIISQTGEASVALDKMNSPVAVKSSPPTLNGVQPYRSESLPPKGPMIIMANAAGTKTSPTRAGE